MNQWFPLFSGEASRGRGIVSNPKSSVRHQTSGIFESAQGGTITPAHVLAAGFCRCMLYVLYVFE